MSAESASIDFDHWEHRFSRFLDDQMEGDAGHDREHVRRVVANARTLARRENARLSVIVPAAWLHDCVSLPKDDPESAQASRLSAKVAIRYLDYVDYPSDTHDGIYHAIEAHSYSGGVEPETTEAKVVQDADRLDALGAVGIARCMRVGASIGTQLYHASDPFCEDRTPNDGRYTIDHFYSKLLTLPDTMQTAAGHAEAERRADVMRDYLDQLRREIEGDERTAP